MTPVLFGTLDPFLEAGPVLGRKVANQGFMAALLAADPFDEYHFFPADQEFARSLEQELKRAFPGAATRVHHRLDLPRVLAANRFHCFHLSDCITNFSHLARLRNRASQRIFPITAPVHSLSYAAYGQAMALHLWPGCTPRDCVVATSRAGESALAAFRDVLRQRLGLSRAAFPGPEVRRIPLGVDPGIFPAPDQDNKEAARKRMAERTDAAWDKTTLLVFGRIHHASKMDLLPLLRGLKRAEAEYDLDLGSLRLVLAGWVEEGDQLPETLAGLARSMGLDMVVRARPDEAEKADLFLASDCFASLADNPQETFGLSILEAMLAGLPVIASDYDGYRDTVVHDETGLLVPTLGPGATPEVDALAPLLFDNQYHLLLAQQTVVAVPELAEGLARLLADTDQARTLRQSMGEAGRGRVMKHYTWGEVVDRHLALWEELNALDLPDREALRNVPHPLHVDYGRTFAAYPTQSFDPDMAVKLGLAGEAFYRGVDAPVLYPGVARQVDLDAARHVCFLARKPVSCRDLAARLAERFPAYADPDRARFLVLWCLKHDLLEIPRQEGGHA